MMKKLFVLPITFLIVFGNLTGMEPGQVEAQTESEAGAQTEAQTRAGVSGTRADTTDAFMFRGNLQHTGVYESTVPKNNSLLWSFDTASPMESSPVVVGDRVYFGSENGRVYCLGASSGIEIWNFPTDNAVKSTPAVEDGLVYVGSSDGNLYVLDAETGLESGKYTLPGPFGQIASSPVVANNKIFFGSTDKSLYAINATTYELEWAFPTENEIWSSPAVEWPYVYVGSLDGKVYSIWANNGTQRWNVSSNVSMSFHSFYASPMISNGRLYIGSEDHNLYSLDAETGELIWNFSAPHYIYSSASVHDGRVFIHTLGTLNGHIYALPEDDPNDDGIINTSEILWSFETGDWDGGSSPAVANGKVLVGSNDKQLFCLNESTGEEIWNLTTGGGIVSSPAIAYGIVYIGSNDGTLYAVGGSESAPLSIQILPEFPVIKSNRVMGISLIVTYRGQPVEGAFITIDVDFGDLSQQGASTFPDGSQRIKYTAPSVDENTSVTVHARVTKFGYPEGESWERFVVEPPSTYGKVSTSSMFSLSKYWVYIGVLGTLIAINVVIVVLNAKKRRKDTNRTKIAHEEGD